MAAQSDPSFYAGCSPRRLPLSPQVKQRVHRTPLKEVATAVTQRRVNHYTVHWHTYNQYTGKTNSCSLAQHVRSPRLRQYQRKSFITGNSLLTSNTPQYLFHIAVSWHEAFLNCYYKRNWLHPGHL